MRQQNDCRKSLGHRTSMRKFLDIPVAKRRRSLEIGSLRRNVCHYGVPDRILTPRNGNAQGVAGSGFPWDALGAAAARQSRQRRTQHQAQASHSAVQADQRQVLVDRPVFDPEVLRAAEEYSRRLSNLIRSMQYCECDCAPAVIARLDRATQYPEAAVTERNGRGVLDPRMRGDDIRGCGGLPRYIQPLTSLQKLEV
jgi:hypothetical protein